MHSNYSDGQYKNCFTAYLNIKRKRLQNCDVTYCDQAFKLTDDMRRDAEHLCAR